MDDDVPFTLFPTAAANIPVDAPPFIPPPPTRSRLPTDPLLPLREWRAAIARVSGQPELAVCSDRVLRSLAQAPPADAAELARRLGITETAAARLRPLPT